MDATNSPREIIRRLEVGAKACFPAERTGYIRPLAYQLSFSENKQFSTHQNRESRQIEVIRIK